MGKQSKNSGLFLLGITLGVAFIIASLLFTDTLKFIKSGNQTIRVKGYAEKVIQSDLANWNMQVSVKSMDKRTAYMQLERDLKLVQRYLVNNGIGEEIIDVAAIQTFEYLEYQDQNSYRPTGRVLSYQLSQTISVESNDVDLIDKLSGKSTELLKEGINFESFNPSYFYTKLNDLKIEMLGLASKDAYTRANQLADNSNGEIGRLTSASQGVFQITDPNSSEVNDYGMFNTSSIQKTIKAVVTMEYTIK